MGISPQIVVNILNEAGVLIDTDGLDHKTNLTEQGVDSLDMANVYFRLEEEYKIKFPDDELSKFDSIEKIVAFVNESKG